MAKTSVEIIGAYVDGHGPGSIVSVDEKSAKYLESIGYGKILKSVEAKETKTEAAPIAGTKPKAKSKSKPKGKAKE